MVIAQKGDVEYIRNREKYKKAEVIKPVTATEKGYITAMDTEKIGLISLELGGGRRVITDKIVPEVGLIIHKKIGDKVEIGDELCEIHANSEEAFEAAKQEYRRAFKLSETPKDKNPLIYESF
jgi:thymidine phosphorylase